MAKAWDRLEIWEGEALIFSMDSSFAPNEGDLINIKKTTYRIVGRSFTIDYAGEVGQCIRCNIIVEREQ